METLEEIARKIIKRYLDDYINDYQLGQQVISALRNERERSAQAGFDAVMALGDSVYEYSVTQKAAMVAASIRKGK